MADDSLIDRYLDDLRASMTWHHAAANIVAEAEDHLRASTERLIASGVDVEDAQRRSLERFGEPAIVARSHALTRHGRLAIPTRATRHAGVVGVIGGACWIAYPAVWLLGGWLYGRVGDDPLGDEVGNPAQVALLMMMTATLLAATGCWLVTSLMLHDRDGGFGLSGLLGMGASGLGVAAAIFGWFYVGWGSVAVVATMLVSIELWLGGLAPKGWVLLTGGGMATGALIWSLLRMAQVGSPDRYGEYLVANATGQIVGSVILGTGLIGLGRWLRSETPVDLHGQVRSGPAVASALASPSS